jgi:transcriptional regulator
MAGSDLYVGTLDVLILKALTWGPMHGYGIGRWIRQTTEEALNVQEGALYPALHRLQRRGLLAARWGVSENNRRAKFYRLTEKGERELGRETETWSRLVDAVARVRGGGA